MSETSTPQPWKDPHIELLKILDKINGWPDTKNTATREVPK